MRCLCTSHHAPPSPPCALSHTNTTRNPRSAARCADPAVRQSSRGLASERHRQRPTTTTTPRPVHRYALRVLCCTLACAHGSGGSRSLGRGRESVRGVVWCGGVRCGGDVTPCPMDLAGSYHPPFPFPHPQTPLLERRRSKDTRASQSSQFGPRAAARPPHGAQRGRIVGAAEGSRRRRRRGQQRARSPVPLPNPR